MHHGLLAWLAGSPQRLAVDCNHLARRQFGNGRHPSGKALLQLLRIERREDPVEGVVRGDATRKRQKTLEPLDLGVTVVFDLVPSVGTAQNRRDADQKYLFQKMFPRPLNPRITQLSKVLQGTVHLPISARQNR
jgi:hypothetical protein